MFSSRIPATAITTSMPVNGNRASTSTFVNRPPPPFIGYIKSASETRSTNPEIFIPSHWILMGEKKTPATWAMLRLGKEMRAARRRARMSLEQVEVLGWSKSAISRLENGKLRLSELDTAALLGIYATPAAERKRILAVARDVDKPGWWLPYRDVLDTMYVEMEDQASEILIWDNNIPPFVQTPATARAQIRVLPNLSERNLERRVRARVQRRFILSRDKPPKVTIVLGEEALIRSRANDPQVSAEQMAELLTLSRQITIHVLPFQTPYDAGIDGRFILLRFTYPQPVTRGYSEGPAGGLYLEAPADIRRLERTFATLVAKAHDPERSRAIIRKYGSGER